ncbi:MAG: aldo/keto reductase [archaeon]
MNINNIEMPELGLGTWRLSGQKCFDAVKIALRLGYKHIDTAEMYGNHKEVGNAISGTNRKKFFLTSKVTPLNLSYNGVKNSCKKALSELGTDYLDLYLVHWPNPLFSIKETFRAMEELKKDGKIRAYGVSNFTIKNLEDAKKYGDFLTNQVEFHPYLYQKKLFNYCTEKGIVLTAYSPIARGAVFKDEKILAIGKKHKKTPGQISLRWLLDKKMIVIPKASTEEHIKENMEVFDFKLTKDDTDILDNLPQKRIVNFGIRKWDD